VFLGNGDARLVTSGKLGTKSGSPFHAQGSTHSKWVLERLPSATIWFPYTHADLWQSPFPRRLPVHGRAMAAVSSQSSKVLLLPFQPLSTAADCPGAGQLPPGKPQARFWKDTAVGRRDRREPGAGCWRHPAGTRLRRRDRQLSVRTQMAPISPGHLPQGRCGQLTVS